MIYTNIKYYLYFLSFLLISHIYCYSLEIESRPERFYVSYHELFPAQVRFSSQNVNEKISKAIATGKTWKKDEFSWSFKYHNGKSLFSEEEALPIVKSPFGYVLTDGHHDVLTSMHFQAEMVPVYVIADLSDLSIEKFWEEAEEKGWAYLYAIGGSKAFPPQSFSDLQNDSNRYFAAITARKFLEGLDGSSFGAEYPLWIKVGKDIPFIEFKISDLLWSKGLTYDERIHGNPPNDTFLELARITLVEGKIEGLRVVEERMRFPEMTTEVPKH